MTVIDQRVRAWLDTPPKRQAVLDEFADNVRYTLCKNQYVVALPAQREKFRKSLEAPDTRSLAADEFVATKFDESAVTPTLVALLETYGRLDDRLHAAEKNLVERAITISARKIIAALSVR